MKKNILCKINIFKNLILSVFILVITPSFVFASSDFNLGGLESPLKGTESLSVFISKILEIVVKVGTPVVVIAIIYSGFLFVKAQGNETEIESAKKTFFWVVIGAATILGASVLGGMIGSTIKSIGA